MRDKFYINRFKDSLDSKIVKYKSIQINVTNKCPCKCNMCRKYEWPQIELSKDTFDSILIEAQSVGIESIVLSGGEPFMYPYLNSIKNTISPIKFGILTTSLGIEKHLDLLDYFEWIRVSIDGFETTHNMIRGANIYDRVQKNIKLIPKNKLRINFTIQKNNYHEFTEFIKMCSYSDIPVYGYMVNYYNELSSADKNILINSLFKLNLKSDYIQTQTNVLDLIIQLLRSPYRSTNCILPMIHCVIDSDESVWPCCYLMHDNIEYSNTNMPKYYKGIFSKSKFDESAHKKEYSECKVCDSFYSRYQRINEEYELLNKKDILFL